MPGPPHTGCSTPEVEGELRYDYSMYVCLWCPKSLTEKHGISPYNNIVALLLIMQLTLTVLTAHTALMAVGCETAVEQAVPLNSTECGGNWWPWVVVAQWLEH